MTTTTITVYGKPSCMQCRMTEHTLDRAGTVYTKRDVTADLDALNTVQRLGYLQVPVVTITHGDTITDHWSGFNPDKIRPHTIRHPQEPHA